jgi:mono/diheme cytochrome c family protein
MPAGGKLIIIALLVTAFYAWFGNSIPQSPWEAPRRLVLSQDMSPMELAQVGRRVFRKGGCGVCHSVTGEKLRGPDLSGVGAEWDPQGMAAILYSGTDEMPPANKPPANLTNEEITALIAYLQSLGGRPTVRLGDIEPQ